MSDRVTPKAGTYGYYTGWLAKSKTGFLAPNTYGKMDGDNFVITLYRTDIITVLPSNVMALTVPNNGEARTRLTKDRLNYFLPAGVEVHVVRGQWWVNATNGSHPFVNGMLIDCDSGQVYEAQKTA